MLCANRNEKVPLLLQASSETERRGAIRSSGHFEETKALWLQASSCAPLPPGFEINHKTVYRLWKKEGLSLPGRKTRKRHGNGGSVPCAAEHVNHVWTYDFV